MKITKVMCDRCNGAINDNHPHKIVIEKTDAIGEISIERVFPAFPDLDFCEDCATKIIEFITIKPGERVASTTVARAKEPDDLEPEQEKYPARKKSPIDKGKMMALWKAGWTNDQIARELHTTTTTIANAICLYRKKHPTER